MRLLAVLLASAAAAPAVHHQHTDAAPQHDTPPTSDTTAAAHVPTHHQHAVEPQQHAHASSGRAHPMPNAPPSPSLPRSHVAGSNDSLPTAGSSYAYDDDRDDGAAPELVLTDYEHMEKDLWTELDIDEDRDEPILKVTVVVLTIGVIAWCCRTHCCSKYRQVPGNSDGQLSPRIRATEPTEADLAFAPDFVIPNGRSPRRSRIFSRESRGDDEGFTLDIFSIISSRLAL